MSNKRTMPFILFLFILAFQQISVAQESCNVYDTVVIGTSVAGLSGAIPVADAHFRVVAIGLAEKAALRGAKCVYNWPVIKPMSGDLIMDELLAQAKKHGVTIFNDIVVEIDFSKFPYQVRTEKSGVFSAKALLLATGRLPRALNVDGVQTYQKCVYAGFVPHVACDKTVVVIGGGDAAFDLATRLAADKAKKVIIIARSKNLKAQPVMQDKIVEYSDRITLVKNKSVKSVIGDGSVMTKLIIKDLESDLEEELFAEKIFLAVGYEPNTVIFKKDLALSDDGYIIVDHSTMSTNIAGVYAAGDVIEGACRKAPVAAGTGIIAADNIVKFLKQ